jgi:hypothetical protein
METHFESSRFSAFNLLKNPFIILGIDPAATNEQVISAFEDALTDARGSETELSEAKHLLLNPRLRLQAELSWFLDSPAEIAHTLYNLLRQNVRTSKLRNKLQSLAPISQINLISHLAGIEPCTSEHIASYIAARCTLRTDAVYSLITELRKAAGIVGT